MTLTQQFLIILTLPAAFILLAVYTLRAGVHRQRVRPYWLLCLLTATLWAGSLLSYYGGSSLPMELTYTWQQAGKYLLSFLALALLLATTRYLLTPQRQAGLVLALSVIFWLAGLLLDPVIWRYSLEGLALAGRPVSHFDLWAAVWVTSWLVPLLAAALLTRQEYLISPGAIYRNQLAYWALTLALFAVGGGIALIQHPGHPIWQEIGALVQIGAALLGTAQLTRPELPDLRLALRRFTIRLTGVALIFALSVLALWILTEIIPQRMAGNTSLYVLLGAMGFTILFMALSRLVNQFMARVFMPRSGTTRLALSDQPQVLENLDSPDKLGQMLLQHVQSRLTTETGCVYVLESANAENVTLTPVSCLEQHIMEPLLLDSESPFVRHLAQHPHRPLAHYDVAALEAFADMHYLEMERLASRQHELYVPLYAGGQWIGLMGLGNKVTGGPYNNQDLDWLEEMSIPAGLLLAQARKLAAWRQRYEEQATTWDYTLERNQHLEALHDLYGKFVKMITPELRRPVVVMSNHLQESNDHNNGMLQMMEDQLAALRLPLESLVALAARLQKEDDFHFEAVYMGDVMRQVQNNLQTMARARRVEIEIDMPMRLPPVRGDEVRLVEAMQQVVHNAIKYNKIGGKVTIIGDVVDGELFVQVMDSGVGMPKDRLEQVWEAYRGNDHDRYGSNTPSMGLLFSRYIIEAHGGRIVADSEYGVGSTFAIYLPIPVTAGR